MEEGNLCFIHMEDEDDEMEDDEREEGIDGDDDEMEEEEMEEGMEERDADALVVDKASGVFADPAKIRPGMEQVQDLVAGPGG